MTKKHKIFSKKIHKGVGIFENPKKNKGTKYLKNYMEDINSKNKNIKGG